MELVIAPSDVARALPKSHGIETEHSIICESQDFN